MDTARHFDSSIHTAERKRPATDMAITRDSTRMRTRVSPMPPLQQIPLEQLFSREVPSSSSGRMGELFGTVYSAGSSASEKERLGPRPFSIVHVPGSVDDPDRDLPATQREKSSNSNSVSEVADSVQLHS